MSERVKHLAIYGRTARIRKKNRKRLGLPTDDFTLKTYLKLMEPILEILHGIYSWVDGMRKGVKRWLESERRGK